MPDDSEQIALTRLREFMQAGSSIDAIRNAGWGEWLDYFEAQGVEVGVEHGSPGRTLQDNTGEGEMSESKELAIEKVERGDSMNDFDDDVRTLETLFGSWVATAPRVMGWVLIIVGPLVSVYAGFAVAAADTVATGGTFATYDDGGYSTGLAVAVSLGGFISSVVTALILISLGNLIQLMNEVERNTRAAALNLIDRE